MLIVLFSTKIHLFSWWYQKIFVPLPPKKSKQSVMDETRKFFVLTIANEVRQIIRSAGAVEPLSQLNAETDAGRLAERLAHIMREMADYARANYAELL